MHRRAPIFVVLAALFALFGAAVAYSYSTYAKWGTLPVTFYLNPTNADVSSAAAVTAVQYAMNVWSSQSGSSFRYQYGGVASDTATAYDNRNVMFFRSATNGGAIATTYSWWDSNQKLLDSDIVVWDAGFKFYTGIIGCGLVSNSAYLEDIATHELGHALGLNHSAYADATMYPSYGFCSQAFRTLATDDINALKASYPAAVTPVNTAPVVTITSPTNGATLVIGSSISLVATATDAEDGNISSRVQWTDNGAAIGSGSLLSNLLSLLGVHTYVARVTDNGGLVGSSQVAITIAASAPPTQATLIFAAKVAYGTEQVSLKWSGLSGTSVDLYRNTIKILTTPNDGKHTDVIQSTAHATYSYYVCAAGTATCTNTVKAVF